MSFDFLQPAEQLAIPVAEEFIHTRRPAPRCFFPLLDHGPDMLLERVAIAAGQPDRVADRHPAVLSRELDGLQREFV